MSDVRFDIPEWVNWLARDQNGALYGYRNKPVKCSGMWGTGSNPENLEEVVVSFISEDPNYYPQVKWSDEEPTAFKDGITVTDIEVLGEDVSDDTPEPDMVNTPPHYKQYSFEPIDIITEVVKEYPPEIGFHIGTTLKYLFRSPFKGNMPQDLAKADYYLQRANKELEESK